MPLALQALAVADRALEKLGVTIAPIDEDALCAAARRKTGLSDFGEERFRTLFHEQFQGAQAREATMPRPVVARVIARLWLSGALRNRLLIEQQIKAYPEILQVTVPRPLVIAGLWRTGTSLLQNLLAQDPGARPLVVWEAFWPAGRAGRRRADTRRSAGARAVKRFARLVPQFRMLTIVEPNLLVECGLLFRNTFLPRPHLMESIRQWCDAFSAETWRWAYQQYYRQLQLLEWQRPAPDHWVLKWPDHLQALDILRTTVPDVAIVQTHRDPGDVIATGCQALNRMGLLPSDEIELRTAQDVTYAVEKILWRAIEARGRIPPASVFDVSYRRLVADPLRVLRQLYAHFGYRYSDEFERRARTWLERHPAPKHSERHYDLAQFGLDRASIERSFAFYSERYQAELRG